jgi:hypothetical protein
MMVSRSSSHTGACLPLSRHVGRQSSTGNIDIPGPTLFIDTSPTNEARPPTVEVSSSLSPLGLTGISPVAHKLNGVVSTGFLGVVDQRIDTQAPNRRRASDPPSSASRPLSPLPEDTLNPDMPVLLKPAPFQSTTRGELNLARSCTAHNRSASSPPTSDLQRVDSSSSQSTSSMSGTSKVRRLFGKKRSETTPDTSPGISSDSSLPSTLSSSNSSLHPGAPPIKPPPTRTWSMLTRKNSKVAAPQPTRLASLSIDLPQTRNWEPVSPVVLGFMEMAASDSECVLRRSTDRTVSAANLEGLVSGVITDIEGPSRNDHFKATFLTIYQLFATSERLFEILKRRFESSELDPVAARSRYP